MQKLRKLSILWCILLVLGLMIIPCASACADEAAKKAGHVEPAYTNPETGYSVTIIDDAALLADADLTEIISTMRPFTEFGNALAATAEVNDQSTVQQLAIAYYDRAFGTEKGAVFLIDMADREIYWYSEGEIYDELSVNSALAITDNAYKYASGSDYAGCIKKAFSQAVTVMNGGRIANKLKYVGNAFLAVLLGLFITYIMVRKTSFIRADHGNIHQEVFELHRSLTYHGEQQTGQRSRKVYQPGTNNYGTTYSGSNYSYNSSGSSYSSGSRSSSGSGYSSGSRSSGSSSHRGGGAGHKF